MNRVLLRRIVCAVDLFDQSVSSFKRALELADLHGAELVLTKASVLIVPTAGVMREAVTVPRGANELVSWTAGVTR